MKKGSHHSKLTKLKLRNTHLGKKQTDIVVAKRVNARKWYKHSETTKKMIGESNKITLLNKWKDKNYRQKMSNAHKGYVMPEEQKKKISEHHKLNGVGKWMIGRKLSIESIKKGVESRKDYKCSEETKLKIGIANKGHRHTEETIDKIKEKVKRGSDHPKWKGGKENTLMLNRKRRVIKLNARGSHILVEWEFLKKKYNFTCPSCGRKEPEIKLTEDHVVPLSRGGSDYIDNIQPLCQSCNSTKNTKTIRFSEIDEFMSIN